LVVACPRGCADAEDGVRGEPQPAWVHRPPPAAERAPGTILRNQTRPRVLEILAEGVPLGAREISLKMGVGDAIQSVTARVEMMLRTLRSEHLVVRTLPPGRRRGYVWALDGRRAT
jgi:hypothetical protein